MKSPKLLRPALAAVFALSLCACGSVEYRQDHQLQEFQSMATPIEVIEGNFVESTNDSEIVYLVPALTYPGSLLAA
jgi:hypothetical protein